MSTFDLIEPDQAVTPSGQKKKRRRPLPPDLQRDAAKRLGFMALLAACLWVVALIADHLAMRAMNPGVPGWARISFQDYVAAVVVAISFLIYFYSRKKNSKPGRMLDISLGYMVLTGIALGLIIHSGPIPKEFPPQPMITWIGVVVLIFSAMVPNVPWRVMVAGFIAVSMNPIGMLIAREQGNWEFGATWKVLLMHYPDYLILAVAVVISGVVMRLGQQVIKAREMGSYRLNELLGKGGMGEVYRATHRLLARPAAIKLIRPDASKGEREAELAITRFRREAEAAANLRSPHTVELYDFGSTDDGTFYFVMELLVGQDLEMLVRQEGPQPASRVIHILKQVAESLEEAHAQGLVHRDIKPANIHLGTLGLKKDFVKVLDFGLVKAVAGEKNTGHSLETAAGLTPGTPSYMAPEMAMGETIDGRADIYALGCVAYWLLTGKRVFEAENALQVVAKHVRTPPVPPSERVSGLSVPPALESLVLACLAKEPEKRPDAHELGKLLADSNSR
jgi:tRNA A-37 threonylcarbamoyl transferase component Bud32